MSRRGKDHIRKFNNWDKFLDPDIDDEKTTQEVIHEMFGDVEISDKFNEYVEDGVRAELFKIVAAIPETNCTPIFDVNYIKEKFLNFTDEIQCQDSNSD